MSRRVVLLSLLTVMALGAAAQAANIIWVSDNKGFVAPDGTADKGWITLLRAQGHNVIYKNEFEFVDGTQYWRTLDPNKIAELNAADLIVLSRNGDSGSYSNVTAATGYSEPNMWNGVTTPLISLNAHMSRTGKWGWFASTTTVKFKEGKLKVVDPNSPVFAGVTIDPNGMVDALNPQWYIDWVGGAMDAGNGKVLATKASDGLVSIATWEAGQKFFEAGTKVAGGPRMLFIAGTGSSNAAPNYSPDGAYNLTAEGEKMFIDAVKFMLNKGTKVIYVTDSPDTDKNGLMDDQGWIDWLTAEGYQVDARRGYWKEALDANRIAELETADLVIAGRSLATSNYDAVGEAAKWNGLKVPLLCLNVWMVRNNSNRWFWVNSVGTSKDVGAPSMRVAESNHPIFAGLPVDANGLLAVIDANVGSGSVSSFNNTLVDGGNGTVLSTFTGIYTSPWIIEWPAGVEFYTGAGQFTGGKRMLFSAGTQDAVPGQAVQTTPQGMFNLNADGQQLLRNIIAHMIAPLPEPVGPSTEGLVAYYALNGDANDSSGNALNGDIVTVGDVNSTATFVDGPAGYGKAIDLLPSGTGTKGSYVNCGADPNFDFVDAMTVGAWINVRSIPDEWRAVVCKGDNAWRISLNGAKTSVQYSIAGYGTRAAFSIDGTTEVGFNSWHYVCGTYDKTVGGCLYIDGALEGTLNDLTGISKNTNNVTIGANEGDTGWKPYRLFDGQIDEVRIYNRALSQDEVNVLAGL
jgi:hypothetical protein